MRVAVDAMGGDYAPAEVVAGALAAAEELGHTVILVGEEEAVKKHVRYSRHRRVEIVHAPEVVTMHEAPAGAVRRKKQSSIVRAVGLVKEGLADAAVSAGHTGATMAAALFLLGRIGNIDRPAIATVIPNATGRTVLLDVGANVDCTPQNLVQFAVMGDVYAERILRVARPRVGLLSVGGEDCKGNELTLAALPLLRQAGLNFVGNLEGHDIFAGTADVVVCDGFVGNVVLKASEGLIKTLEGLLREEVSRRIAARLGVALAWTAVRSLRRRLDYAEYGGAPLLGVNGVVVVAHGRSRARAVKNAVRLAGEASLRELVAGIRERVERETLREAGADA
ncbi:MAG: phosphate acyltransferase PlsX [Firmicutes bacterium]|nr:phosphate acyltransferase PlsX [Bacillota bacterium]